jgi:predicted Rdx family selenoprotein
MARPPIISPWTDEQDDRLRDLAARNVSIVKAAGAMNRTMSSVKIRARKLGLSLPGARELRRKMRDLVTSPAGGPAASE